MRIRGRAAVLAVTLSLTVATVLAHAVAADAQVAASFRDDFTAISYSGNTGSAAWSGPWAESGESDGPTAGSVQVVASDRCLGGAGNCLRIGADGGDLVNHGVTREADLTDATSATLSFHYRRQLQGKPAGVASIQVSGDGGSTWATVGTIALNGPQSASSASFDISSHTGPRTLVRVRVSGQAVTGNLFVDAVEVAAVLAPSSTTTTTVATTTTTTPATTTTTTSATTSTTGAPTSTTLGTGDSTTSSVASTSTTSPSGSGSTTTAPAGTIPSGDPGDPAPGTTGGETSDGDAGSVGPGAGAPTATEGGSPGSEGSTVADDPDSPTAMTEDPPSGSSAGATGARATTTLMAVAADAAVDAALPGAVLLAVVAALTVLGVTPRSEIASAEPPDATGLDGEEPPTEDA